MSTDLWGDIKFTEARLPVTILREQATVLGEKTNNVIQGEVSTTSDKGNFIHRLYVVAPALGNYRYLVLEAIHDIQIYPVVVKSSTRSSDYQCSNEDQFVDVLKIILSSDEVHKVVSSLLNQSQADKFVLMVA